MARKKTGVDLALLNPDEIRRAANRGNPQALGMIRNAFVEHPEVCRPLGDVPEYEITANKERAIAITLLRAAGWLSASTTNTRMGCAGPLFPT